jgi:hypothetical protein
MASDSLCAATSAEKLRHRLQVPAEALALVP